MTSPSPDMTGWSPSGDFWRNRPVAVTGATGFLGNHIVEQLVGLGAEVVILVRDDVPEGPVRAAWSGQVSAVRGAVEDQLVIERMLGDYRAKTVIHLAAQSQVGVGNRHPAETFRANVAGTWALLEAVRRSPDVEQVVTASSDKAYGTQPQLPYHESMPLLAVNPYDASKACADIVAQSYHSTFDVPVCITRCGNFFGPGDSNWQRLVPGTIRSLLTGEVPLIRSDGTMVRDYLYVADGARAYLQLIEKMAADPSVIGEAFNFSTEEPVSVLDLVARIQRAAGTDVDPKVLGEATHEIQEQYLSSSKAHERLGWAPEHRLDDALALTVDWYRFALGPR